MDRLSRYDLPRAAALGACVALAWAGGIANAPAQSSSDRSWVTEYPQARKQTDEACRQKRLENCLAGLNRLLALTDGRPDIRCLLSGYEAQAGRKARALDDATVCAQSQLEFPALESGPQYRSLRDLPAWRQIAEIYRSGLTPVTAHEVQHSLEDPQLLSEDLVYDTADGSFLVSSVHERKIIRVSSEGHVSELLGAHRFPTGGVFALALDRANHILWATTAAGPPSPPFSTKDDGRSAVLKFDLSSLTLLATYELTDGKPHAFGDMTISAEGRVYVADGLGGGVYLIEPASLSMRALVEPGSLRSPQTPALSHDGRTLLVPDYTRGIALVDLQTHALTWMPRPAELTLSGIDGLYWQGRALWAIQNGTNPERILTMSLDESCKRIVGWKVALARAPGLGDPTHGVIVGQFFYFIANSGWDRMDEEGHFKNGPNIAPAQIWRLPLSVQPASDLLCGGHGTTARQSQN